LATHCGRIAEDPLLEHIVQKVNVAESPSSKELYPRLRDELWFTGREWFQNRDCCLPKAPPDGPSCPDDERKVERLVGELSRVTFDHTSNGKLKVQSKDDMKRDGNRSPDAADAFLLTFACTPKPRGNSDAHRREGRYRWYERDDYDWWNS